jgi:hypothetical protein
MPVPLQAVVSSQTFESAFVAGSNVFSFYDTPGGYIVVPNAQW